MYKIGYIDDDFSQFDNLRKKVSRNDSALELIKIPCSSDLNQIMQSIADQRIDVMLVDYKMVKACGYNGSRIVSQINDYIADLPCYILSQVDQDEMTDRLVETRNIIPKSKFDTQAGDVEKQAELEKILKELHEAAEVFRKRQKEKLKEYRILLEQKQNGTLKDEASFKRLYRVLSSYDMVEKLPDEMLGLDLQEQLAVLVKAGQEILKKHGEQS